MESVSHLPIEVFTLLNFKRLAENEINHQGLLEDKRVLNYVLEALHTSDEEILSTAINFLTLLVENPKNRDELRKTELKDALIDFAARRFGVTYVLKSRAEKVLRMLDDKTQLLGKEKLLWPRKVITLQVFGLHLTTRKDLEDILTKKVKGVLTVAIDVEHQRCTCTVFSHVDPKILAEAIRDDSAMEARLITKNKWNQEILLPILDEQEDNPEQPLPEYLEENDPPVQLNAVRSKDFRVTASEWFLTTAGILQKSMYW